jgi:hypothetical protein
VPVTRNIRTAVEVEDADGSALLVVGRFEHDVEVVRRFQDSPKSPALLAAVAAGIPAFGQELGPAAEDVVNWASSTLLGDFALDTAWRQIGHRVTTVRWLAGRVVPLPAR